MKSNKKHAFTLTELLVVVIVIGVLSAAVLPKFNKIIETRKTTEAEEMMAAVRTEQEQRCSLNKRYTDNFANLTNVIASNPTKNYSYTISNTLAPDGKQDSGISAASRGAYSYTLKMPSFADGRICCDTEAAGNKCDKLNKDYPPCNELVARADYARTDVSCRLPANCIGSNTQACGCNNTGTQTRTCNTETGEWGSWSTCSVAQACTCSPDADGMATSKYYGCDGIQTRSCNTSNGTWNAWTVSQEATEAGTRTVHYTPANMTPTDCATRTETQTCSNHEWVWSGNYSNENTSGCSTYLECNIQQKPSTSETCGVASDYSPCQPPTKTRDVTCNHSNGQWQTGAWGSCAATGCKYWNAWANHGSGGYQCASIGSYVPTTTYCYYVGSRANVPHTRSSLLSAKPKDNTQNSFQYAAAGYNPCQNGYTTQMGCYTSDPRICYGNAYDSIAPQELGNVYRKCLSSGELESYATGGCAYFGACMGEFEL